MTALPWLAPWDGGTDLDIPEPLEAAARKPWVSAPEPDDDARDWNYPPKRTGGVW